LPTDDSAFKNTVIRRKSIICRQKLLQPDAKLVIEIEILKVVLNRIVNKRKSLLEEEGQVPLRKNVQD
jgi:hypothetical protein